MELREGNFDFAEVELLRDFTNYIYKISVLDEEQSWEQAAKSAKAVIMNLETYNSLFPCVCCVCMRIIKKDNCFFIIDTLFPMEYIVTTDFKSNKRFKNDFHIK